MKKLIFLFLVIMLSCNSEVSAVNMPQEPVYYNSYPMAVRRISPFESYTPTYESYRRTGYSRPQTRFAYPRRQFSKPVKTYAQKRPAFIYTADYQNQIKDRHLAGMKRQYEVSSEGKNNESIVSRFDKNFNITQLKKVSCGGITYYGIDGACK